MSIYSRFPNGNTSTRRALGVQQVLEWAFRTEKARLELPEPPDPERDEGLGFGLEYVLMQRAALGCRIDGGRYKPDSSAHEDAEVIAATVAVATIASLLKTRKDARGDALPVARHDAR